MKLFLLMLFILSSTASIATVANDVADPNLDDHAYVGDLRSLDIGWPAVGSLSWDKGYLEFKSQHPTKAAKEFFNVYLKDLVDAYIQSGCKGIKNDKPHKRH